MKIYQAEQSINLPADLNLTELLLTSARSPELPASHLIAKDDIEGRTLTVGQLRSNAGKLAHGLVSAFKPRDQSRWAIILPNSVAYLEACHAVLWLGGVFCPINHQLTVRELGAALSLCTPDFIIVNAEVLDKALEALGMWNGHSDSVPVISAIGRTESRPYLHEFIASRVFGHDDIPLHSTTIVKHVV